MPHEPEIGFWSVTTCGSGDICMSGPDATFGDVGDAMLEGDTSDCSEERESSTIGKPDPVRV